MRVKSRLKIIAVIACVFFAFPQKVKATEIETIYYVTHDEETGEEVEQREEFEFYGQFSAEEKALVLFSNLFGNTEKYQIATENVKILNIAMVENCLHLNVSEDIRSYGGGNAYERLLRRKIVKTAIHIKNVDSITLLIDGVSTHLPEGTLIFRETNSS